MAAIRPFGAKAAAFALRSPAQDRRINILEGSVRSGKTWAMIPKLLQLTRYKVGGIGLITGVSKQTIYTNILNDLFDVVGERNYNYNRSSGELLLFNDPWMVIGAKDEGSEKYVRGATVGKWYGDELTLQPKSFFMMALNRMSPAGARMYGTTNPDSPFHYLKMDILDNQDMRDQGDLWTEHFGLDDNPNLTEEYKGFVRRAYTGVFYKRFIEGLWVVAEGAIYRDSWSDENLFDDSTEPVGLRTRGGHLARYIGVDYGTTNPCVFLDVYDDGKTLWIVNEYYWDSAEKMAQKTDAQYADDLLEFMGPERNGEVIIDPSAASFKAELALRGVWLTDADNEVIDGIRMVSSMMSRNLIKVHTKNCPKTIAEAQTYAWDPKAAARGEEAPIKKNDHTCDGKRYVVKTKINSWRLAA